MKKVMLLACTLLMIVSCSKYPDGPPFSIWTKKERLSNTWIVNQALKNDVDYTGDFDDAFRDYTLDITREGVYSLSYSPFGVGNYSEGGTWTFSDDRTQVIFQKSGSSSTTVWTILRLKRKELWGKYKDSNGDNIELHLVEK